MPPSSNMDRVREVAEQIRERYPWITQNSQSTITNSQPEQVAFPVSLSAAQAKARFEIDQQLSVLNMACNLGRNEQELMFAFSSLLFAVLSAAELHGVVMTGQIAVPIPDQAGPGPTMRLAGSLQTATIALPSGDIGRTLELAWNEHVRMHGMPVTSRVAFDQGFRQGRDHERAEALRRRGSVALPNGGAR